MSRKLLIRTSEYPYHVTARANNKEWFYVDAKTAWKIFCHYLSEIQKKHNVNIHAFLMMSNHFHLLLSTPDENIDTAMHYFMSMTAKKIGVIANRINKIWGARYYRSLITTPEYYTHAYRYIYYNPIHAGIINNIAEYPYSTFAKNNYSFNKNLSISSRDGFDIYIPETSQEVKMWINQKVDPIYFESVRKGLKKSEFNFSKSKEIKKYDQFKMYLPPVKNKHQEYFQISQTSNTQILLDI